MTVPRLPSREAAGHKGTFGTVVVVGGCVEPRMIGAPALTARASLRSGCGLVNILAPDPILNTVISMIPSATAHALPVDERGDLVGHACAEVLDASLLRASCVAIGPGLGYSGGQDALVLRTMLQEEAPIVLDADAITVLANMADGAADFRARGVVTPHPGEYRRLAEALSIDADPVEDRADAASKLAQRLGVVAVVKGAGTAVSDGIRTWTCQRGSNVLATGGTGDVLTGCIAGLIAQFDTKVDLFDLTCIAVEAHARASEHWTPKAGMLAEELADRLPEAIDELRKA